MADEPQTPATFRAHLDSAMSRDDGPLVRINAGAGLISWNVGEQSEDEDEAPAEDDEMRLHLPSGVNLGEGKTVRRKAEPQIEFQEVEDAFAAVKAGLQTPEQEKDLRARIARAVARANEAKQIGQLGYSERLLELAAGWACEQQAAVLGYNRWVDRALVERVVKATAKSHNLELVHLERFPRAIPAQVQDHVKRSRPVFTDQWILFTNPKKERLPSKDPILFGTVRAFPERLYYITDWIDEYCDLTMDKLIAIGEAELRDEWKVRTVPVEPTDDDIQELINRVVHRALVRAKPSFFDRVREVVIWVLWGAWKEGK